MESVDPRATFDGGIPVRRPIARTEDSTIPEVTQKHEVALVTPEGEARLIIGEEEYILDACRSAGLLAPSTCLQGWCITCAGQLLEGEVDQSDALRYYPEDREAGFILLCSAKPRSPLRIRTHAKEAMKRCRLARNLPVPLA